MSLFVQLSQPALFLFQEAQPTKGTSSFSPFSQIQQSNVLYWVPLLDTSSALQPQALPQEDALGPPPVMTLKDS